jgi:nicotinamide phosphoribosyltransferase
MNIILATDSYKLQHWKMYPVGTTHVYSYFESRQGAMFPYTMFFGLQYLIMKYLRGQIVTRKNISEAAELCKTHFGDELAFNQKGWEYVLNRYEGRLPLRIKAVPEGMRVPEGNVLMTVENTCPRCPWLTNAVESLLTHVWYPSTVATLSHSVKQLIRPSLELSSENSQMSLGFMLHDFGYRGVSSHESAEIGGAAHLLNFDGTDTVPAIMALAEYYNNGNFNNIAYSVPASEHSVMTAEGRDGEVGIVRQLIATYPKGILSVVGDSYNIYNFVEHIVCKILKDEILARDGVFVIRPDSVTKAHTTPEDEVVWILQTLEKNLGSTLNSKGFKVVHPKIKVLWGDGISRDDIKRIVDSVVGAGFSMDNIATFGMGGGLLQKVNRDTQRFAFKSSWQMRNGVGYDIWKDPIDSSKASKRGRMKLVLNPINSQLQTVPEISPGEDLLETVFLNGKLMKFQNLAQIRSNARS